jgi:hypothetical protein
MKIRFKTLAVPVLSSLAMTLSFSAASALAPGPQGAAGKGSCSSIATYRADQLVPNGGAQWYWVWYSAYTMCLLD